MFQHQTGLILVLSSGRAIIIVKLERRKPLKKADASLSALYRQRSASQSLPLSVCISGSPSSSCLCVRVSHSHTAKRAPSVKSHNATLFEFGRNHQATSERVRPPARPPARPSTSGDVGRVPVDHGALLRVLHATAERHGRVPGESVYSVIICTGTDPSDDCVLRPSSVVNRDTRVGEDQVYCNVCMQYVHKESRHCRLCDKCVAVFDHHCKWLNNCIGKKNYKHFLGSVIGATVLLSLQIALGIYLFWETFERPDAVRRRSASAFGCSTTKDASTGLCMNDDYSLSLLAIKLVHGLMLGFLVPWCFLIAQLTFFHLHLCIENLTTYDYIVRKRKRQLNRERGDNSIRPSFWQLIYARLCCQRPDVRDKSAAGGSGAAAAGVGDRTQNASRISGMSAQSEEEELTAIEAEVDDDLEVLSARSGEVGERDGSNMRSSSGSIHNQRASKGRNSFAPMRGFGLHVNLGAVTGTTTTASSSSGAGANGTANGNGVLIGNGRSSSIGTPTTETSYIAAPHTPRSPRSDAESAYHSEDSDHNRPLPGIPVSDSSSMVMYGRPTSGSSAANHIV